ncbi:IS5 family transposase [Spirillospora sp. NPDC000708]
MELFQRVAPPAPARPQGGGRCRADDRNAQAAIVFVASTGCTWRQLPPIFGASWQTVQRRFTEWPQARGQAAPQHPGRSGCGRRTGLVAVCHRLRQRPGRQRGELTGPTPVDHGKNGSKIHVPVDRAGLPICVGISAANTHDKLGLEPLVRSIPPVRSRRGPRRRRPTKLHADKCYDHADLRRFLGGRGIVARIARRGVERSDRLGRHRRVVERTMSWLNGFRRLHRRYERKPAHFQAFTGIATALIHHRHPTK